MTRNANHAIASTSRNRDALSLPCSVMDPSEGRQAVYVRYRLHEERGLENLPGVSEVSDHGNEAELTLDEGADTTVLLRALVERADLGHFEVREPSLHEIFKRVVRAAS